MLSRNCGSWKRRQAEVDAGVFAGTPSRKAFTTDETDFVGAFFRTPLHRGRWCRVEGEEDFTGYYSNYGYFGGRFTQRISRGTDRFYGLNGWGESLKRVAQNIFLLRKSFRRGFLLLSVTVFIFLSATARARFIPADLIWYYDTSAVFSYKIY